MGDADEREHQHHLLLGGPASSYLSKDVNALRDGLRRFAEAHDRELADRERSSVRGAALIVAADVGPSAGLPLDKSMIEVVLAKVGVMIELESDQAPTASAAGAPAAQGWLHTAHEDDGPAMFEVDQRRRRLQSFQCPIGCQSGWGRQTSAISETGSFRQ